MKTLSRRTFFKNAGIGTAAIAGISFAGHSCSNPDEEKKRISDIFNQGDTILFQGDSITDAHRDKQKETANEAGSFGRGYALLLASRLLGDLPEKELTIYNRGISGDKVYQLADRWEKDCIDLKPDVLSMLIGVNDYWHQRKKNYSGTARTYEEDYRKLLDRTRSSLPDVKLIICEPFILPNTTVVDETWIEPFSAYQNIAAGIAAEFEATWVPFQRAFNAATELAPATYWAADGVHPSMAGAQLMADTWLKSL